MLEKNRPSVLVVRIGRLGDFLVSLPALRALRERYPTHRIVLLTAVSSDRRVMQTAGSYINVSKVGWVEWVKPKWVDDVVFVRNVASIREWWELRHQIPPVQFTYILSYFGERLMGRLTKKAWFRSLGVAGPIFDGGDIVERVVPSAISAQMLIPWQIVLNNPKPLMDQNEWKAPVLEIDVDVVAWVDRTWHATGLKGQSGPIIALFVSGTHEHKRWPEVRFVEVVRLLIESRSAKFVVLGADSDRAVTDRLLKAIPQDAVVDFCGRTSLTQLSGVLARCDFFLGNDGGTAHLAAAVGIPCITIMSGVHNRAVWDPVSKKGKAIRVEALDCIGCGSEFSCPQQHRKCVLEIQAATVVDACEELIEALRNEPSI